MRNPVPERAPRLWRAVGLQLALLAASAVASELPWVKKTPPEPPPKKQVEEAPKPAEHRLRVIHLPPPEKPPEPQKVATAKPPEPQKVATEKPPEPQKVATAKPPEPPKVAKAEPPPRAARPPAPEPAAAAQEPEPRPEPVAERPEPTTTPPPRKLAMVHAPARQLIAADATAVHGVRLHVLVPRTPTDLAAHLRNSGGCMVVSRLAGDGAEVMSLLSLRGGGATLESGAPCDGVPRLVRDRAINAALGDPLGQARAQHPEESGELVLQVLLTPRLNDQAQFALRQRFGNISEQEMGEKAAETGYELTCFAEPGGSVRCQ
jgi:hypothetical protein